MAINEPTSSIEEPKKHIFQDNQKEEFVSRVVESRSDCFQGYDEGFIKDLFNKDYTSQQEFDLLADRLLDSGVIYYFDQVSSQQEYNPLLVEDIKTSLATMVDGFVWSYNDFKDKLIEHADALSTGIIQQKLDVFVKNDVEETIRHILDSIPGLVRAKKDATTYFAKNTIDVSNMFVYPDAFAKEFVFANISEQANIAYLIRSEYQIFLKRIEKTKKDLRDSIDPKEIDAELFDKVHHIHKMVLDWKNRAHKSLHTKIMNCVYSRYIVNTLAAASIQKFPLKA